MEIHAGRVPTTQDGNEFKRKHVLNMFGHVSSASYFCVPVSQHVLLCTTCTYPYMSILHSPH